MAGGTLTTASSLTCPHGGKVIIVAARTVTAGGAPIVNADDSAQVVGCVFTLPGPTPSPCLTVQWVLPDGRASVGGGKTLSQGSVGLCKAGTGAVQGPVIISATQPKVQTQ